MRLCKWFWIMLLALTACIRPNATQSPITTPGLGPILTPIALPTLPLREGMGGVCGRIKLDSLPWENSELMLIVYAAPFYSAEGDTKGFFVLEPSIHPHGIVHPDGSFQLPNVPPGAYVLVIGPTPEESQAFRKHGVIRVFHVEAGQVLDLGELALEE